MVIGTTAAIIGSTLLSAGVGAAASSKQAGAAKQSGQLAADATRYATDKQNEQFNRVLDLQMPAYRVGQGALGLYASALGMPGYDLVTQSQQSQQGQAPTLSGGLAQPPSSGGGKKLPGLAGSLFGKSIVGQLAGGGGGGGATTYVQGPDGKYYDPSTLASYNSDLATYNQRGAASADLGFLKNINIPDMVRNQPGYQSQLDQGVKAAQALASSRGRINSGRTLSALNDVGQRTFGSYYDAWLNRVGGLAGQGSQAAGAVGAAGQAAAGALGNIATSGAGAQGQAAQSAANAWATGAGGIAGSLSSLPYAFGSGTKMPKAPPTGYGYAPSGYDAGGSYWDV